MLSEPAPPEAAFAERAELSEWMDEPCSYEQFRDCLISLRECNRLLLGYRPTLRFLARLIQKRGVENAPLRILDVGCGGGDMLRTIARWARRHKLAVVLTGIDLNPHAARAAAEFSVSEAAIQWRTGDAFVLEEDESFDVILSSLLTHHLPQAEIIRFLGWMESRARVGWFINDLYRSRQSYQGFRVLAFAARWHRFVQHDGPVSIRRSFREADWTSMLQAAAIPSNAVRILHAFPGRLCVERLR